MNKFVASMLFLYFAMGAALAQSIGGSATLTVAVASTSVNIQLPANISTYPSILISEAPTSTGEVFYQLGTSNSVQAIIPPGTPPPPPSPALPPGGICINVGPNNWIAVNSSTISTVVRITQLSTCPTR